MNKNKFISTFIIYLFTLGVVAYLVLFGPPLFEFTKTTDGTTSIKIWGVVSFLPFLALTFRTIFTQPAE